MINLIREFYGDKTVAITGGCGMIGRQLVRAISPFVRQVYVLDDMSRGTAALKIENVTYLKADAGNIDACRYAFNRLRAGHRRTDRVDVVFNLAAVVGGVFHNMNHQMAMFNSNMRLQSAPVVAADQIDVPTFVQVSSVCVYSPKHNNPCREKNGRKGTPHPSNAGYALAKRTGELAAELSGIENVVIVRPGNCYGIGDYFDEATSHVIPALIERALLKKEIIVRGSPETVREFTNSHDVAWGMMVAATAQGREVFNVGSSGKNKTTMGELAEKIRHLAKAYDKPLVFPDEETIGDSERWVDSGKLMKLGWQGPTVDLETGIEELIEWRKLQI